MSYLFTKFGCKTNIMWQLSHILDCPPTAMTFQPHLVGIGFCHLACHQAICLKKITQKWSCRERMKNCENISTFCTDPQKRKNKRESDQYLHSWSLGSLNFFSNNLVINNKRYQLFRYLYSLAKGVFLPLWESKLTFLLSKVLYWLSKENSLQFHICYSIWLSICTICSLLS